MPLEQVARCAQRFTPRVSLVRPDGLLLEVKGSLHLFEGPRRLLCELAHELSKMSLEFTLALSPHSARGAGAGPHREAIDRHG